MFFSVTLLVSKFNVFSLVLLKKKNLTGKERNGPKQKGKDNYIYNKRLISALVLTFKNRLLSQGRKKKKKKRITIKSCVCYGIKFTKSKLPEGCTLTWLPSKWSIMIQWSIQGLQQTSQVPKIRILWLSLFVLKEYFEAVSVFLHCITILKTV